ncbi:MAG: hypothetical protein AAFN94_07715 [Pseudomonadota bacterium]
MIAIDEGVDPLHAIAMQVVVFQQDAVLGSLMSTLECALTARACFACQRSGGFHPDL